MLLKRKSRDGNYENEWDADTEKIEYDGQGNVFLCRQRDV